MADFDVVVSVLPNPPNAVDVDEAVACEPPLAIAPLDPETDFTVESAATTPEAGVDTAVDEADPNTPLTAVLEAGFAPPNTLPTADVMLRLKPDAPDVDAGAVKLKPATAGVVLAVSNLTALLSLLGALCASVVDVTAPGADIVEVADPGSFGFISVEEPTWLKLNPFALEPGDVKLNPAEVGAVDAVSFHPDSVVDPAGLKLNPGTAADLVGASGDLNWKPSVGLALVLTAPSPDGCVDVTASDFSDAEDVTDDVVMTTGFPVTADAEVTSLEFPATLFSSSAAVLFMAGSLNPNKFLAAA